MRLFGLDPSYTNTGISIIDSDIKKIILRAYGLPIGEKTFSNMYICANDRSSIVVKTLFDIYNVYDYGITETPPPVGSFGSGLFALDTLLVYRLQQTFDCPILGVSPMYLSHLHKKRGYKKSESIVLAKKIMNIFINHGYSIDLLGRLSSDMAEAFLFVVRGFVVSINDEISSEVLSLVPWYSDKKEFLLCRK